LPTLPVAARESRWDLFAVALIVVLTLLPVPAASQTLFRIVDDAPLASVVGDEVDGAGLAQRAFIVDIDIELLRSAPAELRLPTPDGRELVATVGVFEDRGGGNLLWRGRLAGEELDGVVLTVEDGVLMGRFGDLEEAYRITLGAGGQRLAEVGTEPTRCAVEGSGNPLTSGAALPTADLPPPVTSAATTEQIDVLMLYTPAAAWRFGSVAGVRAAIRHAGDYVNTAFGNSAIDASVRIVHIAEAPADLASTRTVRMASVLANVTGNAAVRRLRERHRADLVHLVIDESAEVEECGLAWVLGRNETVMSFSPYAYSISSAWCGMEVIFAHQVGHNLGGNHEPSNTTTSPQDAVRPFAFAYINEAESIHTIVGNGTGETVTVNAFSFSGNRGIALGVRDRQENARALRVTAGMASRYSDALASPSGNSAPAAPTELTGYATSDSSVVLNWKDNSNNEDAFELLHTSELAPRNREFSGSPIRTVGPNSVQVDLSGLGRGYHAFAVRARNRGGVSETSNSVAFWLPRDPCTEGEFTACLQRGRFDVWVHFWTGGDVQHGKAKQVDLGDASSLYYFFDENNVEMLIKVLNGCRTNNRFWVFAAAATDLEYNLHVWDTKTGVAVLYRNPAGTVPAAINDSSAFATCDR